MRLKDVELLLFILVVVTLLFLVVLALTSSFLQETCSVTLFEDGSWISPDYSIGEPWPPSCTWEVVNNRRE